MCLGLCKYRNHSNQSNLCWLGKAWDMGVVLPLYTHIHMCLFSFLFMDFKMKISQSNHLWYPSVAWHDLPTKVELCPWICVQATVNFLGLHWFSVW
jgi:hypothetical protein